MIDIRFKNRSAIFTYILFFILFALFLQSCVPTTSRRRGKLSDAMEKASDDNKGDRKVDTEPDPEPEIYEEEDDDYNILNIRQNQMQRLSGDSLNYESNNPSEANRQNDFSDFGFGSSSMWLSIKGGSGVIKGADYFGLNHFNVGLGGFQSQTHRFELNAGFAWTPIQTTSSLNKSLDGGVSMLNIGLNYKWFTTPLHTFLGQYFNFGIKYDYMFWSYKNSIIADTYDDYGNVTGTEKISSDGLSGIEFYTGLGMHLIQTSGFQLGAEASPGVIFWLWETTEGFENDVFSTFWYIKFNVLINFKIK